MALLANCQADLDYLHQRLSRTFGEPVQLFHLMFELEAYFCQRARRVRESGLGTDCVIHELHSGPGGHIVRCGLVEYAITIDGIAVPVINVLNPFSADRQMTLNDFWAVPTRHYQRLYRFLRRGCRPQRCHVSAPIMNQLDRERLWENTIGILERGAEALQRYGVILKRGVLLIGEPGNGKTLAARWLHAHACSLGLGWKTVTPEAYEAARGERRASGLFQLDQPGIILFDDFDMALRNREHVGPGLESSTFLAEMDGLEIRSGIIYLFTSNATLDELDPAFRRPGRIDQIIHLPRPDAVLRQQLIAERWPDEILLDVPLEELVEQTDGCSFAEIEEIKKLLVLEHLETNHWDWQAAWRKFAQRGDEHRSQRRIGFSAESKKPQGWCSEPSPEWYEYPGFH